ncbi:hypothetical protein [Streptomyces sp. NPDC048669]|uniref:hypothetical protein n=1 Tax=Streptomyces sp. NPDC048669 TaxID=3155267 RepID=UPI00341A33E6
MHGARNPRGRRHRVAAGIVAATALGVSACGSDDDGKGGSAGADKGAKAPAKRSVVRSGSTTLAFRAEITSAEDIGGVPPEIMAAQSAKFRAARG